MNKNLLILIGSGLAVVIIAGSVFFFLDKDTSKPEGKNGKPKTNLVASNNNTQSGSERGNETEKPADVENTHGLPFKIDTTDYSKENPKLFLNSRNPEDRIPNGIRMAKIYVARGDCYKAGSILSAQMVDAGYNKFVVKNKKTGDDLLQGDIAGTSLFFMCKDFSAKYVDIKFDGKKVEMKMASKDFKNYGEGYVNINSSTDNSYEGISNGNKIKE